MEILAKFTAPGSSRDGVHLHSWLCSPQPLNKTEKGRDVKTGTKALGYLQLCHLALTWYEEQALLCGLAPAEEFEVTGMNKSIWTDVGSNI